LRREKEKEKGQERGKKNRALVLEFQVGFVSAGRISGLIESCSMY
jgi:hypothetical protein